MIVEQVHKSLTHGVSQQHPNQRLEGQLTEMINMHPDAVTGLRRRRGFKVHSIIGTLTQDGAALSDIPPQNLSDTRVFYKEFSGAGYVLAHNCATGTLFVYSIHGQLLGSIQDPYLVGDVKDFREATVSGFLGILNTRRVPSEHVKPTYRSQTLIPVGFIYAFAGDTDYNYDVTMTHYEYISTGSELGVKGTVLYMTFETGSGTESKIGTWFCKAIDFDVREPVGSKTPEQIKQRVVELRRSIASGSLKLEGSSEHSGHTPTTGEWFGHKLTRAFAVTATGLVMAVEQVLATGHNAGWARGFTDKYNWHVLGSSLLLTSTLSNLSLLAGLDIRTTASSKNMVTSGSFEDGMQVGSKEQLPPRLHPNFDGYIIGTGASLDGRVYWRYDASNQSWVEGVAGSNETEFRDMPVMLSCTADADALQRYIRSMSNPSIRVNFASWEIKLDVQPFVGRTVGNSTNNPTPEFIGQNLTGIAGYQGRLVLLCGNEVYLSRSNRYNEFMRSTVQQVAPSDPIAIQNMNLGGTEFQYAVEYNRDLVLVSPTLQAVIPYSNALTPQNATIHFSSRTSINSEVPPVHSGRELLYCTTNSQGCVQVGRFVPDTNSEHHFTPELMTLHIPTYFPAGVQSWDANSLSGMTVLCNSSNELLVQFSTYQGSELLQNAWGKWVLPWPVVAVWFVLDTLYCVVRRDDMLWVLTLPTTRGYENYPMVDFWRPFSKALKGALRANVANDKAVLVRAGDEHNMAEVELLAGQDSPQIGFEWVPYVDSIVVGIPYESKFTFTPPVLRKEQYVYQAENASARWIASYLQVRDSGAFSYTVRSMYTSKTYNITVSPQGYLGYGTPIGNLEASLQVQSRLLETELDVHTKGLQDLNVIGATSAVKFGARRRHWR